MFERQQLRSWPLLASIAIAIVTATPMIPATIASASPGPDKAVHLHRNATCGSGHFLYADQGTRPNAVDEYRINSDCTLTAIGSIPTTGKQEASFYGANDIATSVANGPCVYHTDSSGQLDSFQVAADGTLTLVSAIKVANNSDSYAGDVHVSADGKYVYVADPPVLDIGSSLIVSLTVGSGCVLTLAGHVASGIQETYSAIALLDTKGLVAVDNMHSVIDVYQITNGTKLSLVSSTPSQLSRPNGITATMTGPLGPMVFNGSIFSGGAVEAHTINGQGVLGSVPGSPAMDPNPSGNGAYVIYDAARRQVIESEVQSNTLGVYGAQNHQLAFLSQAAVPGSDEPTALAILGSELYVNEVMGGPIVSCAIGIGTLTNCQIAATLPTNTGHPEGIGVI